MREFLFLLPPAEALSEFLKAFKAGPEPELIRSEDALGRVSAEGIQAPFSLPAFARATVDGYAVRAADTQGASDNLPAYLNVVGEVSMGEQTELRLMPDACAVIHTGGMLPDGADAVVMIENTQTIRQGEVEILRPTAVGENVIQIGEDVADGAEIIPPGSRLGPAEIGGLMALGITRVDVNRKPRIGIVSSGDEVIPPGDVLRPGQIYDINTYTLSGLVREIGGLPVSYGIAADTFAALKERTGAALKECDAVVLTAGSSLSSRDLTAEVINALGDPGVIVHGVNVRPGKPTILGVCQGKPLVGLPGNPASALVIARLFVTPVVEVMSGLVPPRWRPVLEVPIRINVQSASGREDFIPVSLVEGLKGLEAEPVFGKSNLIFTLVKADGLVHIRAEETGVAAGEVVRVELF